MVKAIKMPKKFGGERYLRRIYGCQNSAANSARRNFFGGQISGGEFGDRRWLRSLPQKAHPCAETRRMTCIDRENPFSGFGAARSDE